MRGIGNMATRGIAYKQTREAGRGCRSQKAIQYYVTGLAEVIFNFEFNLSTNERQKQVD